MTQDTALDILKLGHNVYLTGAAGSGKTYVLNKYIEYLEKNYVDVGITASTGIAATHMGGVTIHSFTGLGIRDKLTEHDISSLLDKQYLHKRFERLKVLIIDEASMLHHFRIDMVDELLQAFKGNELPFGGIQVVLCGDFFQLPPISRRGERPARFVYHSKVWRTAKFKVCYLEEQHRQTDDISLRVLNDIRNNEVNEDTFEILKTRFKFKDGNESSAGFLKEASNGDGYNEGYDEEIIEDVVPEVVHEKVVHDIIETAVHEIKSKVIEPTRLFTHNVDVDTLNEEALDGIEGEGAEYYMESHGKDILVDLLKKSCLAPELLRLKVGAKVMFVKNNFDAGYVNGTLGVVINADDAGPTVRAFNGSIIKPERANWDIEEDGKVKATIIQYPLRLAWAITIHKSQGMSLDAVEVDLSRSFEKGMGYVALSRVRTLDGLTILGINDMALRVHDEVIMVDEKLRTASNRAIEELEILGSDKMRAQKDFIARTATRADKVKKLSTFEQTRLLIDKRMDLKKIAKERGVNEETIVGHIEQLADEDPFFLDTAMYLRNSVPNKKQQLIRQAFAKAHPDIAKEAGEFGAADYNASAYRKAGLAPVKYILGSKASYRDIRLIRVLG